MKDGDLVRFVHPGFPENEKPTIGLLVKYESWEKVATILYKGKILRIPASLCTKAGKKDWEKK